MNGWFVHVVFGEGSSEYYIDPKQRLEDVIDYALKTGTAVRRISASKEDWPKKGDVVWEEK